MIGQNVKTDGESVSSSPIQFVEVLGDTVATSHVVYAILISLIGAFGGYELGLAVFPSIAPPKLVASYSLLLAMVGCVATLVINAKLFKPQRVLSESAANLEDQKQLLAELGIDPMEEGKLLEKDQTTLKELRDLNLLHLFDKDKGENML